MTRARVDKVGTGELLPIRAQNQDRGSGSDHSKQRWRCGEESRGDSDLGTSRVGLEVCRVRMGAEMGLGLKVGPGK